MPKVKKSQNAASSALLKWENSGKKLATALSAYLQSCASLETLSANQDVHRIGIPNRIETSLKTLHIKLFDELSQSHEILARMHNKMSSRFHALPNEILAEIFLDVVYNPGPGEPRFPKMADGIQRILGRLHCLMTVCSTWRNVALELGELWTVVPVTDSKSMRPSLEASSLTLQRSQARTPGKQHHLHLAAVLWGGGCNPNSLLKGAVLPLFTTVNIEARSKSATSSVSYLVQKLLGSQAPLVGSELSIHQYQDSEREPPFRILQPNEYFEFQISIEERQAFERLIESLTALRLRNVNIRWNTIAFSGQLVELHLQSLVLDEVMSAALPQLLKSAPELRTLKLISVIALSHGSRDMPKVTLAKLQSLFLADLFYNVLACALTWIAPGSHGIKVALSRKSWRSLYDRGAFDLEFGEGSSDSSFNAGWVEGEGGVNDKTILDLLGRSNIDTLILNSDICRSRWGNRETLHMMLRSLPHLESLYVIGWDWADGLQGSSLIRAFEPPHSDEPFSYLTEIYILDSNIERAEHLPSIAAIHSLQTLVVDSPKSLKSENVDREEIIQRLKRVVPDFRFAGGSENVGELGYRSWRLW